LASLKTNPLKKALGELKKIMPKSMGTVNDEDLKYFKDT
jgi:hypothetical protein